MWLKEVDIKFGRGILLTFFLFFIPYFVYYSRLD